MTASVPIGPKISLLFSQGNRKVFLSLLIISLTYTLYPEFIFIYMEIFSFVPVSKFIIILVENFVSFIYPQSRIMVWVKYFSNVLCSLLIQMAWAYHLKVATLLCCSICPCLNIVHGHSLKIHSHILLHKHLSLGVGWRFFFN